MKNIKEMNNVKDESYWDIMRDFFKFPLWKQIFLILFHLFIIGAAVMFVSIVWYAGVFIVFLLFLMGS